MGPDDDLRRVARLFRQTRLEALPVVEEGSGRLMGIMTKANLYDAIAEGRLPETPIGDFYSRDVLTLREDASYDQVKE
ncbi:CBS domain-containing protein, partial [Citrobacter sp. AAK_AS5]